MKFTCWNEVCQREISCDCSMECCQGFRMTPHIIDLDEERLTQNEKVGLVLHHICPDCSGWVEC